MKLHYRLNKFSHTLGYDTPEAQMICEAATKVQHYDALVEALERVSLEADYAEGLTWRCVKELRAVLAQIDKA